MTRFERYGYPAVALLGGVLIVITALNQPYNQNEWEQMAPYDSWDPRVVTSGTHQPPLDPLLGSWAQHLLGIGQLQQRLVPVLCGIGSLVVMIGLLRRLKVGEAGVVALAVMATAPIFLRFSAYTRPYALPLFLMLLCAYAAGRWLDDGSRRWLAVSLGAAFLLPLARVPEPVVFLGSSALIVAFLGWRNPEVRRRSWTLAGGLMAALVSVGALTLTALSQATTRNDTTLLDLNLADALHRLPRGLHELMFFVVPLYARWFPWWPITVLVVLAAFLLPASRRRLFATWYWLPLVLAPLVFLLAYHSVNAFPLVEREYRPRFAYFWAPSLTILVAVVGHAVGRLPRLRHARWVGLALVVALLVSQLPRTVWVLTENDGVDLPAAAALLERELPPDAVVLYDGPSRPGFWRQKPFGEDRWFDKAPHPNITWALSIAEGNGHVRGDAGPVYLLILDSRCVYTIACDGPVVPWSHTVEGYRLIRNVGGYRLYAPTQGQAGRAGAVDALTALAEAFPSPYGIADATAAARLLRRSGQAEEARRLLQQHCDELSAPRLAARCLRGGLF